MGAVRRKPVFREVPGRSGKFWDGGRIPASYYLLHLVAKSWGKTREICPENGGCSGDAKSISAGRGWGSPGPCKRRPVLERGAHGARCPGRGRGVKPGSRRSLDRGAHRAQRPNGGGCRQGAGKPGPKREGENGEQKNRSDDTEEYIHFILCVLRGRRQGEQADTQSHSGHGEKRIHFSSSSRGDTHLDGETTLLRDSASPRIRPAAPASEASRAA